MAYAPNGCCATTSGERHGTRCQHSALRPRTLSGLVHNNILSRITEKYRDDLDKFYEWVWKPFEKSFPGNSFDRFITTYSSLKLNGAVSRSRAFPELQLATGMGGTNLFLHFQSCYSSFP